jgi:hypothetical protein
MGTSCSECTNSENDTQIESRINTEPISYRYFNK